MTSRTTPPSQASAAAQRIIREAALREQYLGGISKNTLRRWVAAGKFPSPVVLSDRIHAWRIAEVQQWLATRAALVEVH